MNYEFSLKLSMRNRRIRGNVSLSAVSHNYQGNIFLILRVYTYVFAECGAYRRMHLYVGYGRTLIYAQSGSGCGTRLDYVTGSHNEDGDRINHSFPTLRIIIIPRDPVPGSPARLFSLSLPY